MIEAYMEFSIVHPYAKSLDTLYEMIALWGIRIIKSDSYSGVVAVAMPSDKFKKMFGALPKEGEWDIPSGAETFISIIKVTKVRVRDNQNEKTKTDNDGKKRKRHHRNLS